MRPRLMPSLEYVTKVTKKMSVRNDMKSCPETYRSAVLPHHESKASKTGALRVRAT